MNDRRENAPDHDKGQMTGASHDAVGDTSALNAITSTMETSRAPFPREHVDAAELLLKQNICRELLSAAQEVLGNMRVGSRAGLGWLVEDVMRENSQTFERVMRDMISRVQELANVDSGDVEADHFLRNEVNRRFVRSLRGRIISEEDPKKKEELEQILEMKTQIAESGEDTYKRGELGGFGGISISEIPGWYVLMPEATAQPMLPSDLPST